MSKRLSKAQIRRMSIEQLQQILRDDLFASEEDEMDSNTIAFITKTLARKSEEEQPDCFPDVDEQWESFNKNYRPTSEEASSLYAVITYEDESDKNIKEEDAKTGKFSAKKSKRRIRVMASAAAVFFILFAGGIAADAEGYNIWERFTSWTEKTFSFLPWEASESSTEVAVPEILVPMAEKMEDYGIPTSMLPSYFPEGYEVVEFQNDDNDIGKTVYCMLSNGTNTIILDYTQYKDLENVSIVYQKDESDPDIYVVNGTEYYIMTNDDEYYTIWREGATEGTIYGLQSYEELEAVITSITGA